MAFARKHRYDYTIAMMIQNISQVIDGVSSIDVDRSRIPLLMKHRRKGYREYPFIRLRGTRFDWYAEYKEETDVNGEPIIYVYEVLHHSQMHESVLSNKAVITEGQLRNIIAESIRRVLYN